MHKLKKFSSTGVKNSLDIIIYVDKFFWKETKRKLENKNILFDYNKI